MDSPQPSLPRRRIIQGCAILTATTALILCVCLLLGIGTTSLRIMPDSQGVSVAIQPGWRPTTTAEVRATQTGQVHATRTQVAAETATWRADLYATGTQVAGDLQTIQAEVIQRTATSSALQATGTQLGILQATALEQGTRTAHAATLTARPGATVTARADLLAEAESWPVVLSDQFNRSGSWLIGDFDEEWGSIEMTVENGVYRWHMTSAAGAEEPPAWWSLADERRENTFALSVDVRAVEGPSSTYYGFAFHVQEDTWADFYAVYFADSAMVQAFDVVDGTWSDMFVNRVYEAIRANESNRLVLVAQDEQYNVYINDQWVAYFQQSRLTDGWLGLIGGVPEPGVRAVIEFDNFEVRAPSGRTSR